jgi:uncharacterized protein (TIGR01777 family)
MKFLISGGTGLIGKALVKNLVQAGDQVIVLTRNKDGRTDTDSLQYVSWDARSAEPLIPLMKEIDAVINLAGDNIGEGDWTKAKKERVVSSRVLAGNALSKAIIESNHKPELFIQASAIGYYGTNEGEQLDETSPNGTDFLAGVSQCWEFSSNELESIDIRRVIIRIGVVLDLKSGALPLMVLPFKMFVGGPIGNGRQYVSWIHLQDIVQAIDFILRNKSISGVVNLTSPNPCSNAEFGKMIGKVLQRPYWFPVPGFALKLVLGEKSVLVLDGQHVYPGKLLEHGYPFKFPDLETALRNIYHK